MLFLLSKRFLPIQGFEPVAKFQLAPEDSTAVMYFFGRNLSRAKYMNARTDQGGNHQVDLPHFINDNSV